MGIFKYKVFFLFVFPKKKGNGCIDINSYSGEVLIVTLASILSIQTQFNVIYIGLLTIEIIPEELCRHLDVDLL